MRTRVKIDFNKELYNYMIEELKNYAEIMEDKNAEKLINTIEKYVSLGMEEDGEEYAVIQLFPNDTSELIAILSIAASISVDKPKDHYENLKELRNKQSD